MKRLFIHIFTILCFLSAILAKKGFGPGEQEWGYVNVRPDATMFWWLYYTTANVTSYDKKPLVIWLQGGPGKSSTAYGNFEELGPLDVDSIPRNYTWVKDYNILFIDSPVGTGFSYVNDTSAYATTNPRIANDLLKCMQGFYDKLPNFKTVPTYITTESYGAKMGAEFALVWYQAQKNGTIQSNLTGITLGSPWISPIDTVLNWASFSFKTGLTDQAGAHEIRQTVRKTKAYIHGEHWMEAIKFSRRIQAIIILLTDHVDFYNILTKVNYSEGWNNQENNVLYHNEVLYKYFNNDNEKLEKLMNGPVKKALGLEIEHGKQSRMVFSILQPQIMTSTVPIVERLLNETNLKISVYGGQLDLLVNIASTSIWVDSLKWKNHAIWNSKTIRKPLVVDDIIEGYYKQCKNLAMYWILRSGHMVPKDNPAAMKVILDHLMSS